MLRILHVVTHMNRGGLETMIMNYYRQIDKKIIQFDFLVHRIERADYDDEIESMGGKIYRINALNPFSFHYRKEINDFFQNHNDYKVVHCHLDCMSSLPLKYAKKNHLSVRVAHAHNTSQEQNIKFLLKALYKRKISSYATYLFACSTDAGKWMFSGKPFIVMRNAVDSRKFEYNPNYRIQLRKELGIKNGQILLGNIGRFNEQKNHIFLIKVFRAFLKYSPNAKLLLVGEGGLEQEIFSQCEEYGMAKNVIFAGVRNDIEKIVQAMDVFVFPSLFEGLPVTLVEAQAAGLPCVISDTISKEVILVKDLVTIRSLDENPESWAEHIFSRVGEHRRSQVVEIINSGFDIAESARWLETMYLEMLN